MTRVGVVVLMSVLLVASFFAQEYPAQYRSLFGWDLAFNVLFNTFFFAAAWLLGDALRRRAERERDLEERTRQLEVERELNAARAVTEERLRIARELHDVVAHHVSVMGVQAGAARRVLGREPDRAVAALTTVEQSSRQAVDELRRLVGSCAPTASSAGNRCQRSTAWSASSRTPAPPASTCRSPLPAEILRRPDSPAIIVLATFDRDEYVFEALRAGASGFLLKNAPPEDLVDAIRVVARACWPSSACETACRPSSTPTSTGS